MPVPELRITMQTRLTAGYRTLMTALAAALLSACNLDVSVNGDGAGRVTSEDGKIQCGNTENTCNARFSSKATVALSAQAGPHSAFVRWEGACQGTAPTCILPMSADHEVFARFESLLPADFACGSAGAKAGCLTPKQSDAYYVEQSIKYFQTMESSVDVRVQPHYSLMVARWEWQPWLLLTGLGNANLILTDVLLKLHPTRYKSIDCRAFPTQPFGRCHVVFDYSGELCPIYEEFSFNDAGEMTFIEAWSDYPALIPMQDPEDYWAEGAEVTRLGTRIPGLGTPAGLIDVDSEEMAQAAAEDADVAEFAKRAQQPYRAYFQELAAHASQVAKGCQPPG